MVRQDERNGAAPRRAWSSGRAFDPRYVAAGLGVPNMDVADLRPSENPLDGLLRPGGAHPLLDQERPAGAVAIQRDRDRSEVLGEPGRLRISAAGFGVDVDRARQRIGLQALERVMCE